MRGLDVFMNRNALQVLYSYAAPGTACAPGVG